MQVSVFGVAAPLEETFGSCLRLVASPTVTPLNDAVALPSGFAHGAAGATAAGAEEAALLGAALVADEALAPLLAAAFFGEDDPLFSTTTSTTTAAISTIGAADRADEGDALAAGLARLALPQLLLQLAAGRLAALAPGVHRGGILLRSGRGETSGSVGGRAWTSRPGTAENRHGPGRPAALGRLGRRARAACRAAPTSRSRPRRQEFPAVLIAGFPSDATDTNCYVVAPAAGEQCVVIDPGIGVTGQLDEVIAEHRLHPVAVLLTHGHFDHTFSVLPVCQARDVPAYIHPGDRPQLADPWTWVGMPKGTPLFGTLTFAEPDDVVELPAAGSVSIAGLDFAVTHAPGHSLGSVVFGLTGADESVLFSGDVLFAGSIGRTDLPGGSMQQMLASLRNVVLPMDDETTVRPGHGPATTIARERATNPFLQDLLVISRVSRSCCPAQRFVELAVLDRLRGVFELHGFAPIETPAVESLDQLVRKGEIDKEVYVLRRLHAEGEDGDSGLGLHFDLTVPFARYVLEHAGHLEFPFRRYQIQKVWRGERPQTGRYREFTQADIDVIARDALPFHHDVEIARVMAEALTSLDFLPPLRLQVNNRKLIQGFYEGLGAPDPAAAMRVLDKADKVRPDELAAAVRQRGRAHRAADAGLDGVRRDPRHRHVVRGRGRGTGCHVGPAAPGPRRAGRGRRRLRAAAVRALRHRGGPAHRPRAGLLHRHRVRDADGRVRVAGLDLLGRPVRLAGLGRQGHLPRRRHLAGRDAAADATVPGRRHRRRRARCRRRCWSRCRTRTPGAACDGIAQQLRHRGVPAEVAATPQKYGKQIRYAERRGIPFVWFPAAGDNAHQVKDIRSGDQLDADPSSWAPPEKDLRPQVVVTES